VVRWDTFTCIGWQITLCDADAIWQVMFRSCEVCTQSYRLPLTVEQAKDDDDGDNDELNTQCQLHDLVT